MQYMAVIRHGNSFDLQRSELRQDAVDVAVACYQSDREPPLSTRDEEPKERTKE